jgi:hypothetical protein
MILKMNQIDGVEILQLKQSMVHRKGTSVETQISNSLLVRHLDVYMR